MGFQVPPETFIVFLCSQHQWKRIPQRGTCYRESSPAKPFRVNPWNNKERQIGRAKTTGWVVCRDTVGQVAGRVRVNGGMH